MTIRSKLNALKWLVRLEAQNTVIRIGDALDRAIIKLHRRRYVKKTPSRDGVLGERATQALYQSNIAQLSEALYRAAYPDGPALAERGPELQAFFQNKATDVIDPDRKYT